MKGFLAFATIAVAIAQAPVPASAAGPELWSEPATGMSFVRVPKRCFSMGTAKAPFALEGQALVQSGYKGDFTADERPAHRVCLAPYWIGRHEVRARDWEQVMHRPPPHGQGDEPAAGMSWREAVEFAERLTAAGDGLSNYRLPTEAEWEMACLAGQTELVKFENDAISLLETTVFDRMWSRRQVRAMTLPVGSREANAWGIFDMRGNVAEWVGDAYANDAYRRHSLYDPIQDKGRGRVIRGGSYRSPVAQLRCAERMWLADDEALPLVGLRLVRKLRP